MRAGRTVRERAANARVATAIGWLLVACAKDRGMLRGGIRPRGGKIFRTPGSAEADYPPVTVETSYGAERGRLCGKSGKLLRPGLPNPRCKSSSGFRTRRIRPSGSSTHCRKAHHISNHLDRRHLSRSVQSENRQSDHHASPRQTRCSGSQRQRHRRSCPLLAKHHGGAGRAGRRRGDVGIACTDARRRAPAVQNMSEAMGIDLSVSSGCVVRRPNWTRRAMFRFDHLAVRKSNPCGDQRLCRVRKAQRRL